jgi:Dolichyl-phosphate-mannose-protein mannosyltransferase
MQWMTIVSRAREQAVFAFLLAFFLLLITRNVSTEPYLYDEADYMYAAKLGYVANWSDTPSISMGDFVRSGLGRGNRQALSQHIRASDDVLFYRHFHGPLFHYLLIPVSRLGLSEHGVRMAMLAIPAASLAVIYFGCVWLLPGPAAFVASMLFLASHTVVWSTELAPHQLFALCSLGCLVLLAKWMATGRRAYWYAAVVAAGLAFCTLEVGFVLIVTMAICGWQERLRLGGNLRFAGQSIALFVVTVLVIWPGAIVRLSFVKSYAAMAYLALMRAAPWGNAGFIDTWRARSFDSPLEWGLIAAALVLGFRNRRFHAIAVFVGLMLLATLRVLTSTPRYSLTFLPMLDMLAGLTLIPSIENLRRPASFAIVALAVAGYGFSWIQVVRKPHNSNPRTTAVLTYIHQNGLENKTLLVPQADLATLHYYFPAMRLRGYSGLEASAHDRESFTSDATLGQGAIP